MGKRKRWNRKYVSKKEIDEVPYLFWKEFSDYDRKPKKKERKYRLMVLKRYAKMITNEPQDATAHRKLRKVFNTDKSLMSKLSLPCFVCGGKSEHRHHIIGISSGGNNDQRNIVPLCKRCHEKVHPYMVRKYKAKKKKKHDNKQNWSKEIIKAKKDMERFRYRMGY